MKAVMYNYSDWLEYENEKEFMIKCKKMLEASGFTILKETEHFFKPIGYTGILLLSESHFAVHSFPEEKKIYIEISSCVKKYFDEFIKKLNIYKNSSR